MFKAKARQTIVVVVARGARRRKRNAQSDLALGGCFDDFTPLISSTVCRGLAEVGTDVVEAVSRVTLDIIGTVRPSREQWDVLTQAQLQYLVYIATVLSDGTSFVIVTALETDLKLAVLFLVDGSDIRLGTKTGGSKIG